LAVPDLCGACAADSGSARGEFAREAFPGSWRDRLDRLSVVQPVDRWRRRILEWSDAVYATSKHLVPPELQST